MTTKVKKALIAAAILCVIGLIVGAVGLLMVDFDFKEFVEDNTVENTYTFTEEINMFGIYSDTADVELILTDGTETKVVCRETENEKYDVRLKDDILYVEKAYLRKRWYEYIKISNIFGGAGNLKITVYLPKTEYDGSQIETDTGDITIPAELTFTSLVAKSDTGDINVFASINDVLWIGTDTGNVMVNDVAVGTLKIESDTGNIDIS